MKGKNRTEGNVKWGRKELLFWTGIKEHYKSTWVNEHVWCIEHWDLEKARTEETWKSRLFALKWVIVIILDLRVTMKWNLSECQKGL